MPTGKIERETTQGRADVEETPTAETLGSLARKVLSSSRHAQSRELARASNSLFEFAMLSYRSSLMFDLGRQNHWQKPALKRGSFHTTLADVIRRNTAIDTEISDDVCDVN